MSIVDSLFEAFAPPDEEEREDQSAVSVDEDAAAADPPATDEAEEAPDAAAPAPSAAEEDMLEEVDEHKSEAEDMPVESTVRKHWTEAQDSSLEFALREPWSKKQALQYMQGVRPGVKRVHMRARWRLLQARKNGTAAAVVRRQPAKAKFQSPDSDSESDFNPASDDDASSDASLSGSDQPEEEERKLHRRCYEAEGRTRSEGACATMEAGVDLAPFSGAPLPDDKQLVKAPAMYAKLSLYARLRHDLKDTELDRIKTSVGCGTVRGTAKEVLRGIAYSVSRAVCEAALKIEREQSNGPVNAISEEAVLAAIESLGC